MTLVVAPIGARTAMGVTGHVTLHLFDTVEGVMQCLHGAGLAATALVRRKPLLHLSHCAHHLFVSLTFATVCVLTAAHAVGVQWSGVRAASHYHDLDDILSKHLHSFKMVNRVTVLVNLQM